MCMYIYVCVCVYIYMKEMATHSSIFAWEIPWTKEPGRMAKSIGLQRVGQTEQLSVHTFMILEVYRKLSCL